MSNLPKVTQLQIAGLGFKSKFFKSFFKNSLSELVCTLETCVLEGEVASTVSNSQGREEKDHSVTSVSADSLSALELRCVSFEDLSSSDV